MPEGDTIHRAAATLRRAVGGQELIAFEAPRLAGNGPAPGETVDGVEARGKHLLVRFSGGLVLHTHLRMTGSWHVYRAGERWRRGRGAARAVITTRTAVAVCFDAPVVELLDAGAIRRHPALRRLGPDLCLPEPDIDDAIDRLARLAGGRVAIGDALLDQRVASGIGNVYRSEVCHLHGIDPRTPVVEVTPATRRGLLETAAQLLRRNLTLPARTTVAGAAPGTLAVYGRAGRPCRTCGTAIEADRTGEHARVTYWCPNCQPPVLPRSIRSSEADG